MFTVRAGAITASSGLAAGPNCGVGADQFHAGWRRTWAASAGSIVQKVVCGVFFSSLAGSIPKKQPSDAVLCFGS